MASVMAPSDQSTIGRLAVSELSDAEALVAEAGWNQIAADWRMFLEFGTVYAVRAEGRVVATAATLPYGGRCAWISMVLVAADHRRKGLATRLLRRCIDDVLAAGLVPVLDATPAGRTVYHPLGFQDAWSFQRFAAQAPRADDWQIPAGITIRHANGNSWSSLTAYDATAFGADRGAIIARMQGRLRGADLFATRHDRCAGMLLGRDGRVASHLGPLIAEDDEIAKTLLTHALRIVPGPVFIDLADSKAAVRQWLEGCGFAPQRPFTRMLYGRSTSFDDGLRTYAVIGPEFG
jgi:GNAT superfamily N-acetyltransferase